MIEKFKKSLDQGGNYAALLTDLSNTFGCFPHDLIIAILHAYKFDIPPLRLMHSYLTGRYHKVKVNNSIIRIGFEASLNMGLFNVQLWVQFYLMYFM